MNLRSVICHHYIWVLLRPGGLPQNCSLPYRPVSWLHAAATPALSEPVYRLFLPCSRTRAKCVFTLFFSEDHPDSINEPRVPNHTATCFPDGTFPVLPSCMSNQQNPSPICRCFCILVVTGMAPYTSLWMFSHFCGNRTKKWHAYLSKSKCKTVSV